MSLKEAKRRNLINPNHSIAATMRHTDSKGWFDPETPKSKAAFEKIKEMAAKINVFSDPPTPAP